ncbi:MAG: hypothetical protein OXE02_15750 [Chloroflexi bacterium]|nr:hypothetical protein [Chloroflexota bacterium]
MTNPTKPVRGKVARVINSRQVALNVGEDNGVEVGMIFKILSLEGADIKDPDTGEVLGSVELEKIRVKVVEVRERLSIASTYRKRQVNVGGIGMGLGLHRSNIFEPPKWETRFETLRSEEAPAESLSERDSHVKTGDVVVQILDINVEDSES